MVALAVRIVAKSTGKRRDADRTLRGMTWDHRRAIDPLLATHADCSRSSIPDIDIEWSSRPLHGFEFTPVAELAAIFDLIILDHPFCGDIAASQLPAARWTTSAGSRATPFVGPSLADLSLCKAQLWALPVDAACQVAVSRPDLMARLGCAPPSRLGASCSLSARAAPAQGMQLAIGLRGVHSLMTFFTLCANLGTPCATSTRTSHSPTGTRRARRSSLMRALLAFCPPEALDWNSIALHDAMVARDDLVFCPAVYCYATYAEADQRRPLRFHDLPGPRGTARARRSAAPASASPHIARIREAALDLCPLRRWSPRRSTPSPSITASRRASRAWRDAAIDARFGGCYRDTLRDDGGVLDPATLSPAISASRPRPAS